MQSNQALSFLAAFFFLLVLSLAVGPADRDVPAPVSSSGGSLVRTMVLHSELRSKGPVVLHAPPRRLPVLFFFWRDPVPVGTLDAGTRVRVTAVTETNMFRRRFVWIRVRALAPESASSDPAAGWVRLGSHYVAPGAVSANFERL